MPARTFERRATVPRSGRDVFATLTQVERAADWMTPVIRIERLDEGPLVAGSRYREVRRMGSREIAAVIEVVQVDPPESDGPWSITHASTGMGVRAIYRFTVTPTASADGGPACELVHRAEVQPVNLVGRVAAGLMLRAMQRADGDLVDRFVRALPPV